MVRYRGALRAQNLVEQGDTRVTYDIINGGGITRSMAPARPTPGGSMVPHMER